MSNSNNARERAQLAEKMHEGSYVQAGSSLADFFAHLEQFKPTIPDSVVQHIMEKNGVSSSDPRIARLIALAAQKFIADVALDAMQGAKMSAQGQVRKGTQEVRYTLTSDILAPILAEYGLQPQQPPL